MIATFSHELAHYLTATTRTEPPGGWENWEFATDIAAIFLGFGIFIGNSAFNFNQYTNTGSQGWSFKGSGYLSQSEIMFSLGIFLRLKSLDPASTRPYLKKNLYSLLLESLETIDKKGLIQILSKVEFTPPDINP